MMTRITSANDPTRRALLHAGLGWAGVPAITAAARGTDAATGDCPRTLVLLHLAGGNDGLNTIIPYTDPAYHALRPTLSRVALDVLPIDDRLGFHRSLAPLVSWFDRGRLAVVQGVGYREPDYAHAGSCRIWSTGQREATSDRSWWEVALAGQVIEERASQPRVRYVNRATSQGGTADLVAYQPGGIARTLQAVARMVRSVHPPRLIAARVGGFDTHTDQLRRHARVLGELADGLAAFQQGLEADGVADRVLLAAWSEFGRRPAENRTGGTDHGSAGPVFVLGRAVRGGVYGGPLSLTETDFGNLVPTVDFRDVYATLATGWLRCPLPPPLVAQSHLDAFHAK